MAIANSIPVDHVLKHCIYCRQAKSLSEFGINRGSTDGRRGYCKSCACHKEKKRRLENGDRIREQQRISYHLSPSSAISRAKKWSMANKKRRREISLKYARKNLAKIKAWQKANPQKLREGRRRRQAIRKSRIIGNGGKVTPMEWREILGLTGGRCAYCGYQAKLVVDHFIPIIRGGQTVRGNLVPCCARCNSRKNDREPNQWVIGTFGMEVLDRVLSLMNGTPTSASHVAQKELTLT